MEIFAIILTVATFGASHLAGWISDLKEIQQETEKTECPKTGSPLPGCTRRDK